MNQIAEEICRNHGYVTTDHLRRFTAAQDQPFNPHVAKGVFLAEGWLRTGDEPSTIPSNKGRRISKWVRVYR